jgi:hypothetical protein
LVHTYTRWHYASAVKRHDLSPEIEFNEPLPTLGGPVPTSIAQFERGRGRRRRGGEEREMYDHDESSWDDWSEGEVILDLDGEEDEDGHSVAHSGELTPYDDP